MKIEKDLIMNYTKISRELIQSLTFRPFTKQDYFGFSGVESPIPLIAENQEEGIIMIIDGDVAELYALEGDEYGSVDCVDVVDSIRALPYKTEKQIRIEAEIAKMEKAIEALKVELQ